MAGPGAALVPANRPVTLRQAVTSAVTARKSEAPALTRRGHGQKPPHLAGDAGFNLSINSWQGFN